MATKSILKSVDIRDKHLAKKFVLAMENAEAKQAKPVTFNKKVRSATENDIEELAKGLKKS